jgi:hypothetical protein
MGYTFRRVEMAHYTRETTVAALERVKQAALNGELQLAGACQYLDDTGKPCAVGYLLTQEQRELMKERGELNCEAISSVFPFEVFGGVEAFEAQVGMKWKVASKLQEAFDGALSLDTFENSIHQVLRRADAEGYPE